MFNCSKASLQVDAKSTNARVLTSTEILITYVKSHCLSPAVHFLPLEFLPKFSYLCYLKNHNFHSPISTVHFSSVLVKTVVLLMWKINKEVLVHILPAKTCWWCEEVFHDMVQ